VQLVYGAYRFPVNGVAVTSRTSPVLDYAGRTIRVRTAINCRGYLTGDGQAALTLLENQMRAALLIPYQNLSLLQDSGAVSATSLSSGSTLSGVSITDGPHFPDPMGSEYVTTRTFEFSGEAETVVNGNSANLLAFQESLTFVGTGGPMTMFKNAVNGPLPQRQVVYPRTVCRVIQAGQSVGHLQYPLAPAPKWPAFENVDRRQVVNANPRRVGRGLAEFPITWRYEFESAVPLVGLPTIPPL
jgi:hypothetical protein